jgi:hypothetical protein
LFQLKRALIAWPKKKRTKEGLESRLSEQLLCAHDLCLNTAVEEIERTGLIRGSSVEFFGDKIRF